MGKMKDYAIEQMILEDQRDTAVEALKEIMDRMDKIMELRSEFGTMPLEAIVAKISGAIAVTRFNAASALDNVEKMKELV